MGPGQRRGGMVLDVEVRGSAIEGLGLFAARPYRAGDRIRLVTVLREITQERPLRPDVGERADHCDYADGKVLLIGPPDCYLNHRCDPNAYLSYAAGSCFIVARRDIPSGDEITCDYSINLVGGDTWPCRCGAPRCRGSVKGDYFSLPAALQREYRPLLADWFVRRHRDRLRDAGF